MPKEAQLNEFSRFKALSFDCYGTLIDWEAGIVSHLRPWADRHALEVADEDLLTIFSEIETVVEGEASPAPLYPAVLAETLKRIGRRLGAAVSAEEAEDFGASVGAWPAFPDSAGALARLQERFRLIIVSNVDRSSFAASNRRLGVEFDLIITAEDVRAYKPQPAHFKALLSSLPGLGVEPHQLLHVAQSLYHDHEPVRRFGIESVWIDRRSGREGSGATPTPSGAVSPGWRFPSMAAFADAATQSS